MKSSFEELHVWKNANTLAKALGAIFYKPNFKNYSFQDQIMRACISISNNIAEWNNRGSAKDFIKFLFIAKWSCSETLNMLYLAKDFWYIDEVLAEQFIEDTKNILMQLWKFISYLHSKM